MHDDIHEIVPKIDFSPDKVFAIELHEFSKRINLIKIEKLMNSDIESFA